MMSPEDSPSLPSTITEGFLLQESNPNHNPNSSNPSLKRKRNLPGNPDPDAEVIALSPKSLMATNRFLCEICNKGFQRDQNLQLHRRGHKLPWKLKQRNKLEVIQKKVYVCPEESCVHHEPSRALRDLTGIKKHFSRKHGEKTWKCDKCSKKYAVKSDWKAHSKICGTREYRCDCGTLFSRKDSFVTHRAFCDALTAEQGARFGSTSNIATNFVNMPSFMNAAFTSNNPHHHQARNIPQFLANFQPHQISAPNLGLPEMTQTSSMDMFGPSSSHNQWLNKFQDTTSFANGNISMPILVSRGLKEEEHFKGNLGLSETMNSSSFYDSNPSPNHMSAQMAFTIANNNNNNENINVFLDSISCASQMGDVGSSSLFSASKSNSFMVNNKMNHMSQMMSLCPLGTGSSSGTMSEMEKNRLTRDFLGVSGVTSLPFFQQELDGARLASMGSAMDQLSQFSSRTSGATQQ